MRSLKEYEKVLELKKQGLNNSKISKELKIPRRTVIDWISGKTKLNESKQKNIENFNQLNYLKNKKEAYSYILGLYLGDGYINRTLRGWRLRIFMDYKYNELNKFVIESLKILFPDNKVNFLTVKKKEKPSYITIYVYSLKIEKLFPQIGVGKKHERKINLSLWQENILDYKKLIMGLIHSDGCYYKQTNCNSYYYEFSNCSKDIINIFMNCCKNLNIKYSLCIKNKNGNRQKKYVVNIRKQEDVTKLHNLIGDKNNLVYFV